MRAVVVRSADPTVTRHVLTGWALERGIVLDGLTVARPTLEDGYLELPPEPPMGDLTIALRQLRFDASLLAVRLFRWDSAKK